MATTALLFDLLVLAVVILFALVYLRKGFLQALLDFAGSLVALVASAVGASLLSKLLFNQLFRQPLVNEITQTLAGQQTVDIAGIITQLFGFLPQDIVQTLADTLGQSLDYGAADLAAEVVNQVVAPLLIPIISLLVFLLLFAVFRILLAFVSRLLNGVNYVPLVGRANRAAGFFVGGLIGVIYCFLFLCIIWAVDIGYSGSLADRYLTGSLFLRLVGRFNFFQW